MMRGLEHLPDEERLRELGPFCPQRRRLRGHLMGVYNHLKGECQEDGAGILSGVPSDRARGSGHKLRHRQFPLNTRKNFFTPRVTEHRHRLPREAAGSPSLRILKPRLAVTLSGRLLGELL